MLCIVSQFSFLCCLLFTHAGGLTNDQRVGIIVGSVIGLSILFIICMVIPILICNKRLAARQPRDLANVTSSGVPAVDIAMTQCAAFNGHCV